MKNPEPTCVSISGCAKTYGASVALEPTTLVVEPGEVLALLGPSGCGKTTLLRIVAGLVAPDPGGRIAFNDEDVSDTPIEKRGVGMMFQHYALFPQMTVEANIGYGLRVRGLPVAQIRQRVGELVDLVRLNGLEQRRPAALSGGQRQRVALARAVAVQPRVLLLDEPLTALDAQLKETLRDELALLLRELRITAIHVTHDQHEAMAMADRLAVMQRGRIVQVGDAESLYRQPAHPFVAEFLGRVNRLERSAADIASGVLRVGDQVLPCPPALARSTRLLLRPEDLRLQPSDANEPGARVARRVFLGERLQIFLHTEDQGSLVCETAKDSPHRPGDRVRLALDPSHLMAATEG
ncbi:MAG: ABC transporter ATP-binding protein [Burkholderiales bacterium]|nr:ABC transporter ATP-binding protein [Burkholderiales bacterium]MDE2456498.1 ABC transporter ATP-binding protein [Burkholderiales bacterium]